MMSQSYEIVNRLTNESLTSSQRKNDLRQFATLNGWRPSDSLTEYPGIESLANGHLIVEHGLQNAAVISFLRPQKRFRSLDLNDKLRLLNLSYNNLIHWHLFPDTEGLTFVFNLKDPFVPERLNIEEQSDLWRAESFDRICGRHPNPNIKSLDDALIETLSLWKRHLRADVGDKATNEAISALFNTVLLVRALEDYQKSRKSVKDRVMLNTWDHLQPNSRMMRICLKKCFRLLSANNCPSFLFDDERLRIFDSLDHQTVRSFFRDFYDNRFAPPYKYDFLLISKHALSKIYEHYVSLLRYDEKLPQFSFLPQVPTEVKKTGLGEVYTPQYVARFFARFLKDNLTPSDFRRSKIVDPACGSGIFLRTTLEMQCDPWQDIDPKAAAQKAFPNILGIDIDANACQATRLSLSLLYLILVGRFPKTLNIQSTEALEFYKSHPKYTNSFDVVISNPPFVKWDYIPDRLRDRVAGFLGESRTGRPDLYLAFLKLGLSLVKPGGYLLYILPHAFLIANNAAKLRNEIHSNFWVRFLADLSDVSVFDEVGAYVLLLIVQKKPNYQIDEPKAVVVRCKEFPGRALQEALEGKRFATSFYNIFEVDQSLFGTKEWYILHPRETRLRRKLLSHSTLDKFLVVRQGFITGADDIFIRDRSEIPPGESDIYVPYLSDREMLRYVVPAETSRVVFFPYLGGEKIEAEQLEKQFQQTWEYLQAHSPQLKNRKSVLSGQNPWWRPIRPRSPETMLRPKLVSPHLIILPKFSIDQDGKYAISRGPLLYPRVVGAESEFLYYFLALLNSSAVYWQLATQAHKYSKGYLKLELATLKKISLPDPRRVSTKIMKQIQFLAKSLVHDPSKTELELELDRVAADLYALTKEERSEIGMEV
jgi:methylase of polypeptide subunit release factors